MANANYKIKDNPTYETEIRALKDSDRAQASTVFNPLLETMINNTHAVKREVEAVDGKVKWTQYLSIGKLGLTEQEVADSGTLATIVNKMPSYGHLIANIASGSLLVDLLPDDVVASSRIGILEILNYGTNRCLIIFTNTSRQYSGMTYRCICRSGDATPMTAWIKESDERDLRNLEDALKHELIEVQDKVDALDEKVKWRHYNVLSQMGLTSDNVVAANTLAVICEAMENYSIYTLPSSASTTFGNLLPSNTGTLTITKISSNRVHLDFWRTSTSGAAEKYYALYREDGTGGYVNKISPWVQIAKAEDIPEVKWTQYTSLKDLGLMDEDVVEAGTLAVIVEAMPNWGMISLRVSGASGTATWSNLLPNSAVLYGFLEIKKLENDGAYLIYRNDQYDGADIKVWYANYRTSAGQTGYINKISPWQQVSRQSDLNELAEAVEEAKKSGADGKTKVAKAISDKGQATAADATFDKMAENISKIETGVKTDDATATAAGILSGYTAYVKGVKLSGTMVNQGAVSITLP